MSAAFTPGPWGIDFTEVHGRLYGIRGIVSLARDDEGNPVLRQITGSGGARSWTEHVCLPVGADNDEADFRLIAAAPELYEAVQSALENALYAFANEKNIGEPEYKRRCAIIDRAEAALSKARGDA